jgi:hypothetical protein
MRSPPRIAIGISPANAGMFLAIHHYPAIIGSAVRRTVHIVNPRSVTPSAGKKRLPVGENLRSGRRGDPAIEIVVDDKFHQVLASVGKDDSQRQDLVCSMAARPLRMGRSHGDATDHHVVLVARAPVGDHPGQFGIYLRCALTWDRDIACRKERQCAS